MKPETWFIDIDGVLIEHLGKGSIRQWITDNPRTVEGAKELLDRLERDGHHIVLVTARPESLRHRTRLELERRGLIYHQLIMGITSGVRYLVNDAKESGQTSAVAFTVPRNTIPTNLRGER